MSSALSQIELIKQKVNMMGLISKAIRIAELMGEQASKKHGSTYTYDDKKLGIWYDDYGNNLTVSYEGEVKLTTHLGILQQAILQNEWLEHFYNIYTHADMLDQELIKNEIQKKIEETKEKWKDEIDDQKIVEKYVQDAPWTKKRDIAPQMRLLLGETVLELRDRISEHLKEGWIELHREERTIDMIDSNAHIDLGYNYAVMEKIEDEQ